MKKRLPVLAVVTALVIGVTGSAYAFDCIRVSSSAKGLAASVKSGNWFPIFFGTADEVQQTLLEEFNIDATHDQAVCVATAYAATHQPQYFAIGIGVAGGKKSTLPSHGARGDFFGIIAWHNKNTQVLGNGSGIDHLEASGIFGAVVGSVEGCGLVFPPGP